MCPFILPELTKHGQYLDPIKLLQFITLPLDEYDVLLRKDRKIRLCALFLKPLPSLSSLGIASNSRHDPGFAHALRRLAAIITIQAYWRGHWTMLKYSLVRFGESSMYAFDNQSQRSLTSVFADSNEEPLETFLSNESTIPELSPQERWYQKYQAYVLLSQTQNQDPPFWDEFCALKIQATWKMYLAKQALKNTKLSIQQGIRQTHFLTKELNREKIYLVRKDNDLAATRIQRAWRRFQDRKFYFILKDFVRSREKLHPSKVLKFINPKEAQLIDPAAKICMRMRLGGTEYPPQIYYKLFIRSPAIDLNAFSPRNYVNPTDTQKTTWYKRFENNGWRPLLPYLNPYDILNDPTFLRTNYRNIEYPALPTVRKEEFLRRRKLKRRAWLRQLYQTNMEDMEVDQELNEIQEIVDWSHALDFDAYLNEWYGLATTLIENKTQIHFFSSDSPSERASTASSISVDTTNDRIQQRTSSAKTYQSMDSDRIYLS